MTVQRKPDRIELIRKYFSTHPDVIFAVIFGSFAEGRQTKVSDIDIGVYTNRELQLLEIGQLVADIENIVKHKVDIVILNDLHKRSPAFAYQIIRTCRPLIIRDEAKFLAFKTKVMLTYLDTRYLYDMVNRAFIDRIKNQNIGT